MDGTQSSRIVADAVRMLHFGVVLFVVLGLPAIVAGNLLAWPLVNDRAFRALHLGTIVFVVSGTWLGFACPLTALESRLRVRAGAAPYHGGFVEHWVRRLLFPAAPAWAFTAAFTAFGVLVVAAWWYFPPVAQR